MRLWTIQPPEVLKIIETSGEFTCDPKLSMQDFSQAYHWLVKQMDEKDIKHPYGLELPIWAWYKIDGKNEKPDLTDGRFGMPGDKLVCIEIEVDAQDVLLSDFYAWHSVLNEGFLDSALTEEEWDLQHNWFDALAPEIQEKVMKESWKDIFKINPIDNNFVSRGQEVQAVFWRLTKEMVKSYEYFTVQADELEE